MKSWQSNRRRRAPSPFADLPKPEPAPRNERVVNRPIRCGSVQSVAEMIQLAPAELKPLLAEQVLGIPQPRTGFLEHADPEREREERTPCP